MSLITLPYTAQASTWPHQGRHILAQFDAETVVVYQAYRPEIGQFAATVRLQWDPDHDPAGRPLTRRALQLGLRGTTLARYAREWIVAIEDISAFVATQRQVLAAGRLDQLEMPREEMYLVTDELIALRLGIDAPKDRQKR